jgi:hypothetical protein
VPVGRAGLWESVVSVDGASARGGEYLRQVGFRSMPIDSTRTACNDCMHGSVQNIKIKIGETVHVSSQSRFLRAFFARVNVCWQLCGNGKGSATS